eukprot:2309958-Pleurochrysis_carterae.AAC.1
MPRTQRAAPPELAEKSTVPPPAKRASPRAVSVASASAARAAAPARFPFASTAVLCRRRGQSRCQCRPP